MIPTPNEVKKRAIDRQAHADEVSPKVPYSQQTCPNCGSHKWAVRSSRRISDITRLRRIFCHQCGVSWRVAVEQIFDDNQMVEQIPNR